MGLKRSFTKFLSLFGFSFLATSSVTPIHATTLLEAPKETLPLNLEPIEVGDQFVLGTTAPDAVVNLNVVTDSYRSTLQVKADSNGFFRADVAELTIGSTIKMASSLNNMTSEEVATTVTETAATTEASKVFKEAIATIDETKTESNIEALVVSQDGYDEELHQEKEALDKVEEEITTHLAETKEIEGEITLLQETKETLTQETLELSNLEQDLNAEIAKLEADLEAAQREKEEKERNTFIVPVENAKVTSWYGEVRDLILLDGRHWQDVHDGIDYVNTQEVYAPILASNSGTVVYSGSGDPNGGTGVIIKHENGLHSFYFHLSGLDVHVGDHVERGQKIGTMGATGAATGVHLHFAIKDGYYGQAIDPNTVLTQ